MSAAVDIEAGLEVEETGSDFTLACLVVCSIGYDGVFYLDFVFGTR